MRPVPETIRRAAAERLAATMEGQAHVEDAIRSRRPLDAEEDIERKLAFIEQKLDVSRPLAERIAAYEDPQRLPLTPAQRAGAESLQGLTVDFAGIFFFDLGRAASRSVARVAYDNRQPIGTGFMVSPNLFLTNHHVIPNADEARSMLLEFSYEVDADLKPLPVSRFRLDPGKLFLFDDEDDLDFALVAVGERVDGPGDLSSFGYLPLLDTKDKHIKSIFVNVIQHPAGRPKELVIRENRVVGRTHNTLIYGADTLKGSSGSPVFNDDWEVLALHHWGTPWRARLDNPPPGFTTVGNEGIRISSIVQQLASEMNGLTAAKRALVRELINPPFRRPSLAMKKEGEMKEPAVRPNNLRGERDALSPQIDADGTATWTLPLVVSVRLGGAQHSAGAAPAGGEGPAADRGYNLDGQGPIALRAEGEPAAEKFKPDTDYYNRKGYNPKFLGLRVALPRLKEELLDSAAPNLQAQGDDDPYELKYQNFSIVMNGDRRLPFFTAVNIDGSSIVRINRKTGKITYVEAEDEGGEGAEAYEVWYDDSRIDAAMRSDQSLYDDPEMKRFQRGHLVKRTDPSWGHPERALRGQADTFHFTNCAPQHQGFNPVDSRWAGLENWITKRSDDQDMRVTVFTGPVFGSNDPKRGYIRVPLRFWKVVARVEDGELLATAVIADQTDLVKSGEEALGQEDLGQMPDLVKTYQVKVSKIEELTDLDFGTLRDYDTFEGGGEGMEGAEGVSDLGLRRRIHKPEDLQIKRRRRGARAGRR